LNSDRPFDSNQLNKLNKPNQPLLVLGLQFPMADSGYACSHGEHPNLVCTTFVANALLDAFDSVGDRTMPGNGGECGRLHCEQTLLYRGLLRWPAFAIPPLIPARGFTMPIFWGCLSVSGLQTQRGNKTDLLENALKVARYSASKQKEDGSWDYGEHATQRWIDNFHTGYNLGALRDIRTYTGIEDFEPCVEKGFKFYIEHFFKKDGAPKYFYDREYPLDIHCVAQSMITLMMFKDLNPKSEALTLSVFRWSFANLHSPKGFYFYQITPYYARRCQYLHTQWTRRRIQCRRHDARRNHGTSCQT
jgi:hypothetical protein